MWKETSLSLSIVHSSPQCIHAGVVSQSDFFLISFTYVRPQLCYKQDFWNFLSAIHSFVKIPWIVIGDFNDIMQMSEKSCGRDISHRCRQFTNWIDQCGLIDHPSSGPLYTWIGQTFDNDRIRMRLDRGLINTAWRLHLPNSTINVLPRAHSDHNPLFLSPSTTTTRATCPTRFLSAWLSHPQFEEVFASAWLSNTGTISNTIDHVSEVAREWNKHCFGNVHQKKRRLLARISGIQRLLHPSESLKKLEKDLQIQYNQVLKWEEEIWYQKSKVMRIQNGDLNTKYYHLMTLARRSSNRVSGLQITEGQWCFNSDMLREHVTKHFHTLYTEPNQGNSSHPYIAPFNYINSNQHANLCSPFLLPEVKAATFGIGALKSPGPDGIPALFFQKYWHVVAPTITNMVNEAFTTGIFPAEINHSFITLIPKVDNPEVVTQLRPISLCNTTYKIIMKCMVNRIRPLLDSLISPFQSSFLTGRSTHDNILLTQEVMHRFKHYQGRKGSMLLKIDLEKAYEKSCGLFSGIPLFYSIFLVIMST